MSPFTNPIVGGTALVRPAIKSPNYVPGVSGWSINRDGSAEFGAGDASELLLGDVQAFVLGAGATRQEALVIESGMFAGGNRPSITLSSDSFDVTVLSRIEHLASLHNFLGAISIDSQVYKEKAWHQVGAGGEPAFAGNWANFGGSDQAAAFRLGIKNDV